MAKELCITTDFYDDLQYSKTRLQEHHIDAIMAYSASLGATRFEWLYTTLWNIYDDDNPLGYDVLKVACDAAHRHGMRFDAVFKPFESGPITWKKTFPHSFPVDEGDPVVINENGILYNMQPFVAAHQHMRLARRQGDGEDPGGRLAEVRLVTLPGLQPDISPDDIAFRFSTTNGNFQTCEGALETSITKEWRLSYPYADALCTVFHFTGFDLPVEAKYLEVRCDKLSADGSFSNHIEQLVELVNDRGELIPCAPSTVNPDPRKMYEIAKRVADLGTITYLNKPAVRELLNDFDTFNAHVQANAKGMYSWAAQWEVFTLDRESSGVIAVCRGKPKVHPSSLHPIYPEVRQHWLDHVQYCIDRGVDGVNIRISRHGGMNEPWAYGFNKPVIDQLDDPDNTYEAALVNGQAFDTFMQDAADLLHANGKEIGVHLCGFIVRGPDKLMGTTKPSAFVWNWETWVREIVDYAEFHKTNFFNVHHAKDIVDHFSHVVHEAGKPLIYQSAQSGAVTHFAGPHPFLAFEMDWIGNHPKVPIYNLYETASFMRLNANGEMEGSPAIRNLIKTNWQPFTQGGTPCHIQSSN